MDKQDVAYAYNVLLFSHKRDENTDMCSKMEELKNMLSERSQKQEGTFPAARQIHRDRKQTDDGQGLGEIRSDCLNG